MSNWTTERLTRCLVETMRNRAYLVATEVMIDFQSRADVVCMARKIRPEPFMVFEVKVSRADFLQDIRREKWRRYIPAGPVSFAVPKGLVDVGEVPAEAGLIIRHGSGWRWVRHPKHERRAPGWEIYVRFVLRATDEARADERQRIRPRRVEAWALQDAKNKLQTIEVAAE